MKNNLTDCLLILTSKRTKKLNKKELEMWNMSWQFLLIMSIESTISRLSSASFAEKMERQMLIKLEIFFLVRSFQPRYRTWSSNDRYRLFHCGGIVRKTTVVFSHWWNSSDIPNTLSILIMDSIIMDRIRSNISFFP